MEATGKSDNFQVPAGASKRTNDMETGKDNIADDLKKTVKITDDNPCVYFYKVTRIHALFLHWLLP